MGGMEFNKLMAAVLVAGIIASLSGFISGKFYHAYELHEDAVPVEGAADAGGAAQKEKLPEPILALIAGADLERGEKLFRACAACHSPTKGGPHGTGPNLWNVANHDIAAKDDFSYSDVMAEMPGEWGYLELNKFLWKPKWYVPGTKMNYIGLKKPEDRAAMIAWMRTLTDNPAPLPTEADIAAELALLAPPPAEENLEEGAEAVTDAAADTPEN